jgi:signal transduction histidine kinase
MHSKMRSKPAPAAASSHASPARPSTDDLSDLVAKLDSARSELNTLYTELERLNRLGTMGTIAGMIAHEFNNILTPVMSYAQLAAAAPEDHALARKAIQRTVAGTERAAKIADAILGFVREDRTADAAFHVEQPASTCIAQVVQDAVSCLARDPARDGIQLRLTIAPNIRASIDATQLQQVLVNLILNAVNAMGSKGGELEIAASRWSEEPPTAANAADSRTSGSSDTLSAAPTPEATESRGPWTCIVVRDSGRGISPAQLAGMFTLFSTNSEGPRRGTGLGMVIAKRLIERAGGWITVESALGRGTAVTVILPAA